ncbi:MAG: hypothetical protein ACR2PT_07390 [Endozoicomonas sp.]
MKTGINNVWNQAIMVALGAFLITSGPAVIGTALAEGAGADTVQTSELALPETKKRKRPLLEVTEIMTLIQPSMTYYLRCHPGLSVQSFSLNAVDPDDLEKFNERCNAIFVKHKNASKGFFSNYGQIDLTELTGAVKAFFPEAAFRTEAVIIKRETRSDAGRYELKKTAEELRKHGIEVDVLEKDTNGNTPKQVHAGSQSIDERVAYLADEVTEYEYPEAIVTYTLKILVPVGGFSNILKAKFSGLNSQLQAGTWDIKDKSEEGIQVRQEEIYHQARFVALLRPYERIEVNQQLVSILSQMLATDLSVTPYPAIMQEEILGYSPYAVRQYYEESQERFYKYTTENDYQDTSKDFLQDESEQVCQDESCVMVDVMAMATWVWANSRGSRKDLNYHEIVQPKGDKQPE